MPRLTFDPTTHTYTLDGQVVPSITQVLREAGLIEATGDERALTRGSEVHRFCRLLDEDALDWADVPEAYAGYVRAWEQFRAATHLDIEAAEIPVASVLHRFAGRPDRIGRTPMGKFIVEIKTGRPAPWAALQTAAQALAETEQSGEAVMRRWAVWLKPEGAYSVIPHEDRNDGRLFLCALALYQWKAAHGLLHPPAEIMDPWKEESHGARTPEPASQPGDPEPDRDGSGESQSSERDPENSQGLAPGNQSSLFSDH